MSPDAIFAFEVAVKGIAQHKGIAPGTVRAWWMGSLCTETAKLTARMLLDAATAAFDTARPGRRRFHPLGDEFNNDLTSAKDVPAQERHVAADGHQRAHSSLLPSAFLQDVRKGCEPRAWEAAEVADAEAFGGDAVAVPAWVKGVGFSLDACALITLIPYRLWTPGSSWFVLYFSQL